MADSIFRVKKTNQFTVIPNSLFNDTRLSLKAIGLHSSILAKPDNWTVMIDDVVRSHKDGRDSVYSAIKELIGAGYWVKYPIRAGNRIESWQTDIYELPVTDPAKRIAKVQKYEWSYTVTYEDKHCEDFDLNDKPIESRVLVDPEREYEEIVANRKYWRSPSPEDTVFDIFGLPTTDPSSIRGIGGAGKGEKKRIVYPTKQQSQDSENPLLPEKAEIEKSSTDSVLPGKAEVEKNSADFVLPDFLLPENPKVQQPYINNKKLINKDLSLTQSINPSQLVDSTVTDGWTESEQRELEAIFEQCDFESEYLDGDMISFVKNAITQMFYTERLVVCRANYPQEKVRRLLHTVDSEHIFNALEVLRKSQKPVRNPLGYFCSALYNVIATGDNIFFAINVDGQAEASEESSFDLQDAFHAALRASQKKMQKREEI